MRCSFELSIFRLLVPLTAVRRCCRYFARVSRGTETTTDAITERVRDPTPPLLLTPFDDVILPLLLLLLQWAPLKKDEEGGGDLFSCEGALKVAFLQTVCLWERTVLSLLGKVLNLRGKIAN